MFNLNEFINNMTVATEDEELNQAKDLVEATAILCDDKWLSRQAYFGLAGAMERQLEYLGGTLLPNIEDKITRMESGGIFSESYVVDSWFGSTNEDNRHLNEEKPKDQEIDDQKSFKEELNSRMRTAAIVFVVCVKAHDEVSKELDQLTYSGIKAKAAKNRENVRNYNQTQRRTG
jgi:hypothetical protein